MHFMTILPLTRRVLAGLGLVAWALAGHAACGDELTGLVVDKGQARPKAGAVPGGKTLEASAADNLPPELQLQLVAREAVRRSAGAGAASLLAEAARFDEDQARAALAPSVTLGGSLGPARSTYDGATLRSGMQLQGTVAATGILWDGGRTQAVIRYRQEMRDAARFSAQATQEQVVLDALSAVLERNRYRNQARVYQQYARKMGCLVEALDQIVAVDKGRASELLQARKTQAQAELARDGALALSRQLEIRLQRYVGDQGTVGEGVSGPLGQLMDTGEIIRLIERSSELQLVRAQADGARNLAESADASLKPQLSWNANATRGAQGGVPNSSIQAGLSLSYNLFNGGADQSAAAAAARRAEAARRQYDETLQTRTARAFEVQELATSAFDRARRYVEVLKDSERVRTATFQQWSQLGKRSLFDVMAAEGDHFSLRVAYVNALYDGYQASAQLRSIGGGLLGWLNVGDVPGGVR